tara:strand:+ start:7494 stop:7967 length:474 start_codon:yes stop_codon:yes gene_type:complete
MANHHLINITLDERSMVRRTPEIEHERAVAIYDLLEDNQFEPLGSPGGPYHLYLGVEENRLKFELRAEDDQTRLGVVKLSMTPFRRIVKDYFHICESYFEAIKTASPSQIEAVDMGRRGLHNEGAELLRARLEGKVRMDENTARRLFTLVCVLHVKG